MSGVLSTLTPRGDADNVLARGQAEVGPPPPAWYEFDWDATKASAEAAYFDVPGRSQELRSGEMAFAAAELAKLTGGKATDYYFIVPGEPGGNAPVVDERKFWADLARVRLSKPDALGDLGKDRADYDRQRVQRLQQGAASREQRMARQGVLGNLAGGVAGSFTDPINLLTMGAGGGGRTVATQIIRNGLLNMAIEGGETPLLALERNAQGRVLTQDEALWNIGLAGVGGAAFDAAGKALPVAGGFAAKQIVKGSSAVIDKALPLDVRMAAALRQAVPEHALSPQQAAALHVIERGHEIDASNPFQHSYEALDAHAAEIDRVIREVEQLPVPASAPVAAVDPATTAARRSPSPRKAQGGMLDGTIVNFFRSKGYSEAQARGIAAGIHAESRSDPHVRGGYQGRAVGIGQWLGPRRDALLREFGPNPTLEQQLEFMHRELQGGDPGGSAVLAARDEAAVLDAYIRKFMRPAPGAETDGDISRGMAALGRTGEVPGPAAGAGAAGLADGVEVDPVRPAALDAERPVLEVRPDAMEEGLAASLRTLLPDRSVKLNDFAALGKALEVDEAQLRRALDRLVGRGELTVTAKGSYRRLAGPANLGPEDMLRFIAKRGGLAYDGLSERGRVGGSLGHDLKNSGSLATFVPGAGPLLRPGGKGLDEMGELLHDAGYFGPPSVTPRPTEAELITLLDDVIRTKEKRYSSFDVGPEPKATAADFRPPADETLPAEDDFWDYMDAVTARAGVRDGALFRHQLEAIQRLAREGTDVLPPLPPGERPSPEALTPYVHEWINREVDAALEANYIELDDPIYDAFDDVLAREAGAAEAGGGGRAADAGEPGALGEGAGAGQGAGQAAGLNPAALDEAEAAGALGPVLPDEAAHRAFDDPAGDGVQAAADSIWHDIRQSYAADPNIADVQRQQAKLKAEAPLRAKAEQDGVMGSPLFDAADQPVFDLGDGKPPRTAQQIDDELSAGEAGIDAIKGCLK